MLFVNVDFFFYKFKIDLFQFACKSNREYRAFEICQLMDSIALNLAIRYATKSGKTTLAQKITDELIEQKQEIEQKQKQIQRLSSPIKETETRTTTTTNSTISFSSTIQEKQTTRPKVSTSTGPFNNPFRKKNLSNPVNQINETSANDEFSQWKPSVNKSKIISNSKITIQVSLTLLFLLKIYCFIQSETITENDDHSTSGKRKIEQSDDENTEDNIAKTKRNRLQQFACNR